MCVRLQPGRPLRRGTPTGPAPMRVQRGVFRAPRPEQDKLTHRRVGKDSRAAQEEDMEEDKGVDSDRDREEEDMEEEQEGQEEQAESGGEELEEVLEAGEEAALPHLEGACSGILNLTSPGLFQPVARSAMWHILSARGGHNRYARKFRRPWGQCKWKISTATGGWKRG